MTEEKLLEEIQALKKDMEEMKEQSKYVSEQGLELYKIAWKQENTARAERVKDEKRRTDYLVADLNFRRKAWEKENSCDRCGVTDVALFRVNKKFDLCKKHAKGLLRLIELREEAILDYIDDEVESNDSQDQE